MIEKLYRTPVPYVILIGMVLSAYLFIKLMEYAENGDLFMVILLGLSIGIIAVFITRTLNYHKSSLFFKK